MRFSLTLTVTTLCLGLCTPPAPAQETLVPVIDGEWWQIAGDPDLGDYTRENQQPVDFGVWQAIDGTWQLWSCIRGTGCGQHTRLFYRWEGQNLTDADWRPMGIAMEAKTQLGESSGGLQAPHVIRHQGLYYMAYGDWVNICFATSKDGKSFERVIQPNGRTGIFTEGAGFNTRDAMLIQIDELWHCYYTASPLGRGYGYCRTSPDLKTWSHSCVVSYGGQVGSGPWQNECPHVVEIEPGLFYYFRNQYYGARARNWVYCSRNPLNFGIDDDSKLVRSWHLAAPEIIRHEDQYYIAALMDSLKGIKMARLKWVRLPAVGEPMFDFSSQAARDAWQLKIGNLASVFTSSKRSNFGNRTEYFVGTAEIGDGTFDDSLRGVIESPVFEMRQESYVVYTSGGKDLDKLYVALIEAETGKELARATGTGDNELKQTVLRCPGGTGKMVILRVVDQATDSWGHINFGGIYEDPLAPYRD